MASVAQPKLRSRKHGAAVPLDELDKKLLNLMQGSFPIEPRPYARVAELAGVPEDEVMRRVQDLIDDRIIRQVTPIFDTRALGYASMLVAAKVDPENPH
ncbi:MAG: siroheme decarboxylase, partial [Thermoleophilaceae bacterium]|nr:siroheme decarboxylase [Thermoleophilaceae bacterium]